MATFDLAGVQTLLEEAVEEERKRYQAVIDAMEEEKMKDRKLVSSESHLRYAELTPAVQIDNLNEEIRSLKEELQGVDERHQRDMAAQLKRQEAYYNNLHSRMLDEARDDGLASNASHDFETKLLDKLQTLDREMNYLKLVAETAKNELKAERDWRKKEMEEAKKMSEEALLAAIEEANEQHSIRLRKKEDEYLAAVKRCEALNKRLESSDNEIAMLAKMLREEKNKAKIVYQKVTCNLCGKVNDFISKSEEAKKL
eukprot:746009-Hanusia_phi.AAC.3